MREVKRGKIKVHTQFLLKPTPLAYHILTKYAEIPELMAPERVLLSNIERMKRAIGARKVSLLCFSCRNQIEEVQIRKLPEKPTCGECRSGLLANLRIGQDQKMVKDILKRRLDGKKLTIEELEQLTNSRKANSRPHFELRQKSLNIVTS